MQINFNTLLIINYIFVGIILSIILFIFLRRVLTYPYHFLFQKRNIFYNNILNNFDYKISSCGKYEGVYSKTKTSFNIRSIIDRNALEEIIIEGINSIKNPSEKDLWIKAYENSGIIDWRIRQLKYSGTWKRRISADILGKSCSNKAITSLILALRDEDEDVRLIAVKALGKLKVESAIEYILSLIKDFSDTRCPIISDILIDYGKKAVPYMEKIIGNCDLKTSYWVLRSLSEIELKSPLDSESTNIPSSLEETLRKLLNSKDEGVRAYSLLSLAKLFEFRKYSLKKINGPESNLNYFAELETISDFLNDKSEIVRAMAAAALSSIANAKSASNLIRALADNCWEVNYEASRSLIKLFFKYRYKELKDDLERNLSHPKNIVRKRCREILENIKLIEDYKLDYNEYL